MSTTSATSSSATARSGNSDGAMGSEFWDPPTRGLPAIRGWVNARDNHGCCPPSQFDEDGPGFAVFAATATRILLRTVHHCAKRQAPAAIMMLATNDAHAAIA